MISGKSDETINKANQKQKTKENEPKKIINEVEDGEGAREKRFDSIPLAASRCCMLPTNCPVLFIIIINHIINNNLQFYYMNNLR